MRLLIQNMAVTDRPGAVGSCRVVLTRLSTMVRPPPGFSSACKVPPTASAKPPATASPKVAPEFAGGREGLHHELHRGQQFPGPRVAGREIHRGERAVVDAQGETVTVEDVEDVPGAAYEAEHLGDVHGVARPSVGEQLAELRSPERVKAAGGAGLLLERDRVLDPDLVQDEVLPGGRLLVGRDTLVDQVRHRGPSPAEERSLPVVKSCHRSPSDPMGFEPPRRPYVRVHWTPALPVVKRSSADT
jgi:hypothetical protein